MSLSGNWGKKRFKQILFQCVWNVVFFSTLFLVKRKHVEDWLMIIDARAFSAGVWKRDEGAFEHHRIEWSSDDFKSIEFRGQLVDQTSYSHPIIKSIQVDGFNMFQSWDGRVARLAVACSHQLPSRNWRRGRTPCAFKFHVECFWNRIQQQKPRRNKQIQSQSMQSEKKDPIWVQQIRVCPCFCFTPMYGPSKRSPEKMMEEIVG